MLIGMEGILAPNPRSFRVVVIVQETLLRRAILSEDTAGEKGMEQGKTIEIAMEVEEMVMCAAKTRIETEAGIEIGVVTETEARTETETGTEVETDIGTETIAEIAEEIGTMITDTGTEIEIEIAGIESRRKGGHIHGAGAGAGMKKLKVATCVTKAAAECPKAQMVRAAPAETETLTGTEKGLPGESVTDTMIETVEEDTVRREVIFRAGSVARPLPLKVSRRIAGTVKGRRRRYERRLWLPSSALELLS
mmetsp:Transcript_28513/g.48208  ORF Transcript_28513/g.48208 Transcript_28513/m.48208 type:complete len:251 (+) Transcript_28513:594-1346(+)